MSLLRKSSKVTMLLTLCYQEKNVQVLKLEKVTIQSGNFKGKKKKKEKKIIAHQPQTETLIRDNIYLRR